MAPNQRRPAIGARPWAVTSATQRLLTSLAVAVYATTAHAASFQGLGVLPLRSTLLQSHAAGVSYDGSVVVGTVETDDDPVAFFWTANSGTMTAVELLDPGFPTSGAAAVSASGGLVVGHAGSQNGQQAYYRTSAGAVVGLGDLSGGQFASEATAVSANGNQIAGTGHSAFGQEAFRFAHPNGPIVGLGFLSGGISSEARGVSPDGGAIVGSSVTFSALAGEAFRWSDAAGMVGLGDLPGGQRESTAYGVSAAGAVVVGHGTSAQGREAFRWTAGGEMQSLGDLPGGPTHSVARAVSAGGTTIVGEGQTAATNSTAFLWDPSAGMRGLKSVLVDDFGLASELAAWDLLSATGISGDGRVVVGTGINPSGNIEAWRAELGTAINIAGETITEPVTLGFGDILQGFGVAQAVVAAPGSKIAASGGDLTMGDRSSSDTYYEIFTGSSNVFLAGTQATIHQDGFVLGGDPAAGAQGRIVADGTLQVEGSARGWLAQHAESDLQFVTRAVEGNASEVAGYSLAQPVQLTAGGVVDLTQWDGVMRNVVFGCPGCPSGEQVAAVRLDVAGGIGPGIKRMGDVVFESTSTLSVEIAGATPGDDFGQLDHTLDGGTARLGGTLDLQLVDGYVPVGGETFELIRTTGGIRGTFDEVVVPTLNDLQFQIVYSPTTVVLRVDLPGDFNSDGKVLGEDFLQWGRGDSPDPYSADDFANWQSNYGVGISSPAGAQIPEPASLLLLTSALALALVAFQRPARCVLPTG